MIVLWCLFFVVCTSFTSVEAVVGGAFVQIKDYPYYVSLINDEIGFFCGGSLLSESWVITAAHCIGVKSDNDIRISSGRSTQEHTVLSNIERIVVHGYYSDFGDNGFIDHDIALIKLRSPLSFTPLQRPIKLKCDRPEYGDTVVVSGLGLQGNARGVAQALKTTELQVKECDSETSNFFCVDVEATVSCPGDSGGPVVINGELAGLVSHGSPCSPVSYYNGVDVYTLLYNYRDWIAKHTGIHC